MISKMKIKQFFWFMLMAVSCNAYADITCSGKVLTVLQYANGSVNVKTSYRNDYTYICNTVSNWKGISPDACRSMLSIALSAKAVDKNILVYYSGNQFSCATIPKYTNSPSPVYVGIDQ